MEQNNNLLPIINLINGIHCNKKIELLEENNKKQIINQTSSEVKKYIKENVESYVQEFILTYIDTCIEEINHDEFIKKIEMKNLQACKVLESKTDKLINLLQKQLNESKNKINKIDTELFYLDVKLKEKKYNFNFILILVNLFHLFFTFYLMSKKTK
jgi:hypothetical protein